MKSDPKDIARPMNGPSLASRIPIVPLGLGLLLLAPFASVLIHPAGRILGNSHGDNPAMFYYINAFAGRCWRAGAVPLWNPHIMLGLPFLGEGQAAIFHPLSWLFILLPTGLAINWLVALSFLLSGLFFYGYLRALELSVPAALGGALAWSFSTILGGRIYAGHLTILLELIEVPLILMLWELYLRRRRLHCLLGLAVAYGLMILAAYPQVLYIFSLFLLLYAVIESLPDLLGGGARPETWRGLLLLAGFMAAGVGIGAVQLLPMADFAGQSARARTSIDFCASFSFSFGHLLGFVAPRFCGFSPDDGPSPYWGWYNFWEMGYYIGILPLILAFPGVLAAPRRRRWALLVCGVVFCLIAVGTRTPLFGLLFHILPGFSYFRGPSKYMLVVQVCAVTFSAYGLEALLRPPEGRGRRNFILSTLAGVVLTLAAIAILYWVIQKLFNLTSMNTDNAKVRFRTLWAQGELRRALAWTAAAAAVIGWGWFTRARWRKCLATAVLALTLADLLWVFLPLVDHYPESLTSYSYIMKAPLRAEPYPSRVLGPTWFANMAMRYGFASVSGYAGNVLERYNNLVNTVKGEPPDTLQALDPIQDYREPYRFMAFDYVIVSRESPPEGYEIAAQQPPIYMVRLPNAFPRAFLAAAPRVAGGKAEALSWVVAPEHDLLAEPVIERENLEGIETGPLSGEESAQITAFSATRVELIVRSARRRVLVLCEAYEKNWSATVDGSEARIFPANYLFRGVAVPAGESRVVFRYTPLSFRIGLIISMISIGALGALALVLYGRRGSRSPKDGV